MLAVRFFSCALGSFSFKTFKVPNDINQMIKTTDEIYLSIFSKWGNEM